MQFNSLHDRARLGLPLAIVSAAAFGTSGAFAKALFTGGWSPLAAVTARIGIAAIVLAIPAMIAMNGRWHLLRRNTGTVALYGLAGVAGIQLLYFLAIERLSVGVALMLEYLSPVLLVLLAWATSKRAPSAMTAAGTVTAMIGLALVLEIFGGVQLDLLGVIFALGASVCSATYFLVAASTREDGLPPMALTGFGLLAGLASLVVVALTGVIPFEVSADDVVLMDSSVSIVVPLIGLGLVAAALAYSTGLISARILGSRVASFVALAEVLFAVLFAWIALGEIPRAVQLLGGVLIVSGVILVRLAERDEDEPNTPAMTLGREHEAV
ncbi:EamA family transporter [Demetria terragena]|uniref:EamA family transporter n=1 Tax=Demetria terragena TaxID=63959 RepID=UPI00036810D9|nr:DMT family transporter [Demetria terragena]